jgi:hypothetical protein
VPSTEPVGSRVRISLGMVVDSVFVLCCVSSGLCDELNIRSDKSKCLTVSDIETSSMKRPRPELVCCTTETKKYLYF